MDLNGDGVNYADDKTNIGDPNPHHVFGLRFSANYKNFDLSVTTNGVAGNKIVQSYRSPGQWANWTSDILSRWHGEGTSNYNAPNNSKQFQLGRIFRSLYS